MLDRQELLLDPERILEFHRFLESEFLLAPAVEILVQFEVHDHRHVDAGNRKRLPEKPFGLSRVLQKFATSAADMTVSVCLSPAGTGLWSYRTVYPAFREKMSVRDATSAVSEFSL